MRCLLFFSVFFQLLFLLATEADLVRAQNFQKITDDPAVNKTKFSVGSSWIDINNDGYQDLYVANNRQDANSLFINNGKGTFTTDNSRIITQDFDRGSAPVWADFDNDGDQDLFVANASNRRNNFYINQGDGYFKLDSTSIIARDLQTSITAAWGDYNGDGYVDLFVGHGFGDKRNSLYRNNGNGSFTEITSGPIGDVYSDTRSAAWGDMDGDEDLDLFVANVDSERDLLFENQGDGTFKKISSGPVVETVRTSPSASWVDYDNDSDLDLFVAGGNHKSNLLYNNDGRGDFTRITEGTLVEQPQSAQGHCWADFNNDSRLDVYISGGHGRQAHSNSLFLGKEDGGFKSVNEGIAVTDSTVSRGVSCADINKDGYIDIFVANAHDQNNSLYKNQASGNNWLALDLQSGKNKQTVLGTKVHLLTKRNGEKLWQTRVVSSQTGHRSQNSFIVHFGLGENKEADSLVVNWSSGNKTIRTDIGSNQFVNITEDSGSFAVNVKKVPAIAGDTAVVPVQVENMPREISSFELYFEGFLQSVKNAWVYTTNSLLSNGAWELATNEVSDTLKIAAASGKAISEEGTLLKLKMTVPDTVTSKIPINLVYALFDTDQVPSHINNGGMVFPEIGDIDYNGVVQAYDASVIMNYLIQQETFTEIERRLADVTQNGDVTAMDASTILKYLVDKYKSLPIDTAQVADVSIKNITMKDKSGAVGDQIEIPIHVGKASNVQSFNGVMSYNREILDLKGVKKGDGLKGFKISYTSQKGKIYFSAASSENANFEKQEVLTAKFEIKSEGEEAQKSQLSLDSIRFNEAEIIHDIADSDIIVGNKDQNSDLPTKIKLKQNYPNPFNPSTTIRYSIPKPHQVKLYVFNTVGQKIATLVDRKMQAGRHVTIFNATQFPSGVYIYQLQVGAVTKTRKMTLLK